MIEIKKYSSIDKPLDCTPNKGRKIEYIVLHYSATVLSKSGTAKNVCAWWNKDPGQASADFVVDDDEIWQYNPDLDNYYCWHCGGRKLNYGPAPYKGIATNKNSIGIEMCSYRNDKNSDATAEADGWYISDKVISNTKKLVNMLCKQYNLQSDRIITHFDVTGKLCPRPFVTCVSTGSWKLVDKYMEQFRTMEDDDKAVVTDEISSFADKYQSKYPNQCKFEILHYDYSTNSMKVVAYFNDLTKITSEFDIKSVNINQNYLSFVTLLGELYIVKYNPVRFYE